MITAIALSWLAASAVSLPILVVMAFNSPSDRELWPNMSHDDRERLL